MSNQTNSGAAGSTGQAFILAGGTGNQLIDGVLGGVGWIFPAGGAFTYSFPTSPGIYGYTAFPSGEQNELLNFSAVSSAAEQNAVRSALALVSSYTLLTFTEIAETNTAHANFRVANWNGGGGSTHGYYPNGFEAMGDVYLNINDVRASTYLNPAKGDWGFATIMHELGHTLGLKHGQDNGGPGSTLGPVPQFGPLPAENNSWNYSLMTYASYQGAGTDPVEGIVASDNPTSYMQADIAALQALYGANFNSNSTDTTYTWNAATGAMSINGVDQGATQAGKIFQTIWDGNGTDTYDTSNFTGAQTIDLRPGAFSTFSAAQLADLDKSATFRAADGNIANALLFNNDARSLIENAKTGSGNDTITGNNADNVITGGGGNDRIDGGAGSDTAVYSDKAASVVVFLAGAADAAVTIGAEQDTIRNIENLVGGAGKDSLVGDGFFNILSGGGEADYLFSNGFNADGTLKAGAGNDVLNGDAGNDGLFAGDGNDTLNGGDGDDGLVGGGGGDILNGGLGTDFLFGGGFSAAGARLDGSGNDTLNGGDGNDGLYGFDGGDVINGDAGNDYVEGGAGADTLNGGAGSDFLLGEADADIINGGAGFDYEYGGAGADSFIFRKGDSADWILDFSAAQGDKLRFQGFGFANFAAVPLVDVSTPGNPAVQLTVLNAADGSFDQLTVFGVTLAQLNATNVLLA